MRLAYTITYIPYVFQFLLTLNVNLSTEVDRDLLDLFLSEECFHFTGINPIKHTSIGFNA